MRKFIYLMLFFSIFFFDFIFFDYEISDMVKTRIDYTQVQKKYQNENDNLLPFFAINSSVEIKNCKQLKENKENLINFNVFDKDKFKTIGRNCDILSILQYARNTKKNFINYIELSNISKWSGDMIFNYNCSRTKQIKTPENYKKMSLKELQNNNFIDIYTSNTRQELVIFDKLNNRPMKIREIVRGNFNEDDYMEILLEIAIGDENNNYIKCYKVDTFSRENNNILIHSSNNNL